MAGPVLKAILGVTGVVIISRALGMLREIVVARQFGTSADYDLYLVAIMLPALAFGVLNFAFYYLLVPYLTRKLQGQGDDAPVPREVWSVASGTIAASILVALLLAVSAPWVMKIWGTGFSDSEFELILLFARLVSIIVVLGSAEAFLRALLNSMNQFTYPAGGWIMFNLFSIIIISLFGDSLGIKTLAIALIGGLLIQNLYLLARVIALRIGRGFRFGISGTDFHMIWSAASVLLLVEILNRSYFLIDRYFGLPLGDGVVSAVNYSYVLVQLPDSVIGFAIGTVLFPLFAIRHHEEEESKFARLYTRGISSGLLVALPVAIFVFINAIDLVRLIFMRGSFDSVSLTMTATALRAHAPSIVALFIISTSIRACYARNRALMVLIATGLLLLTKFIATWLLSEKFGFIGITMATSIAQLGFAAWLLILVLRGMNGEGPGFVVRLLKILTSGAGTYLIVTLLQPQLIDYIGGSGTAAVIGRVISSGLIVVAGFILLVYLLRLQSLLPSINLHKGSS